MLNKRSRLFWIAVAAMLAVMGGLMVEAARLETQTFDEGVHLVAGYAYLTQSAFDLNWEHPPLGKLLSAAMLLPLAPKLRSEARAWHTTGEWPLAHEFLYENTSSPDTMLFLGRLPTIGITLLLGAALAVWGRRRFGAGVALFALFLYVTDPGFLAHGHYVTTDVIAALFYFLSVVTWARFLATGQRRDLVLAGVVLGLAQVSKFSMLILFLLLPLLYLIRWWQEPRRYSLRHFAGSMVVVCGIAFVTLLTVYGRYNFDAAVSDRGFPVHEVVHRTNPVGNFLYWLSGRVHVPSHAYLLGFALVAHSSTGRETYLLGKITDAGTWDYFPVVFAVKTPTAILLLMAAGIVVALWRLGAIRRLRRAPFHWFVLGVPPTLYFLLALVNRLDVGHRHLLPIYPFLFLTLAAVFAHRRWVPLVVLAAALQVTEVARIAPHYLAFFNTISGGPEKGPEYLLDSNIDWGQDLKNLRRWLDQHGYKKVCLSYFGQADRAYYGFGPTEPPFGAEVRSWGVYPDCVVAASVTPLHGLYTKPEWLAWLLPMTPTARIGYSIYVYDLRGKSPPR